MFDRGYLTIGRWRGAPIRLHWSIPLGALLFSGGQFAPFFWIGFFGLVLAHEFGHAIVARRLRQQVLSIDVTGFGGMCRYSGTASSYDRSRIAWGGVLAQGVVLGVALAVAVTTPIEETGVGRSLLAVLISTNLWIMGLNLLPIPPLDGAQAWPLIPRLWARWRGARIMRGVRRRSRVPSSRPVSKPKGGNGGAPARDMADFLKQISDEAGQARRGGSSDREK